jgi:prephenate dehydrogenase
MRISTLAILGVGLLGGSVALAARRRGVAARLIGSDHDPRVLDRAMRDGLFDEVLLSPSHTVADAELVVVCTPVDCIVEQVLSVAANGRPGCLITDVGSTKAAILRHLQGRLPAGIEFVGSHPLAGSEKHGLAHADAHLLEGRLVLVTPSADSSDSALSRIRDFWTALGAHVRVMDAEEHDRALALTSHLPHLLSSALAGILPPQWHDLTATGFRDTTRLAAAHPALWSAIFQSNQSHLLAALDRLEQQLTRFRLALTAGDRTAVEALLQQGKTVGDELYRG